MPGHPLSAGTPRLADMTPDRSLVRLSEMADLRAAKIIPSEGDTRPYVGLSPVTPQSAAGCRTDPPVSVPKAAGTSLAATAAADPPLDPPGTRPRSQGLLVGWNAEFSVDDPIANSSRLHLPTRTAPSAKSRSMAVAL